MMKEGSFPVYACLTDSIDTLERNMQKLDVKTRRVWPAFQNYAAEQLTKNVCTLRDHLLLLDTDNFTEDKLRRLTLQCSAV